ncbi:MAG: hypothetical protein GX905_05360 [Bacteroidales bacterium]|nr:hypothetical protein [Bacteroidales bacterium]
MGINDHGNEQWYSNKDLFEMLQDLKEDLHNTRIDLRKYNDLRGTIAELQKAQLSQAEACKKHLFDPDGATAKMQIEINYLRAQVEEYRSRVKGRKSVEEGFLRWCGWVFGLVDLAISLIKLFSS